MEKVAWEVAGRAGVGPRPVSASLGHFISSAQSSGSLWAGNGEAQGIRIVTSRWKHNVPCQFVKKTSGGSSVH